MRKLEEYSGFGKRVESGALQIGDDWPGTFIRGDNSAYYAHALRKAVKILEGLTKLKRWLENYY